MILEWILLKDKIIKVVKIIDDYTVIINCGYNEDIKKGTKYLIYEVGEEIFDPDTRESLGSLELVKGVGKITHIQEKMATLESVEKEKILDEKRVNSPYGNIFGATKEVYREVQKAFKNPKKGDLVKPYR